MNQKFIRNTFTTGLILGALALGNINANATGFHTGINNTGRVISSEQFYEMVNKTKPTEVAVKFGRPDKISTLKNAKGDQEGVVWTYEKAVTEHNAKLNANFVFIEGEFKFVNLSND